MISTSFKLYSKLSPKNSFKKFSSLWDRKYFYLRTGFILPQPFNLFQVCNSSLSIRNEEATLSLSTDWPSPSVPALLISVSHHVSTPLSHVFGEEWPIILSFLGVHRFPSRVVILLLSCFFKSHLFLYP